MRVYEMELLNADCVYSAIGCARAFVALTEEQRGDVAGWCISDAARDYLEAATYEAYGEVDKPLVCNLLNIIGGMVEINPSVSDASIIDALNKCGVCITGQRFQ
jgi:hypothetical protein